MIFKTFLKYSILELCFTSIIDTFNKNFTQVKNKEILHIEDIKVGQYFSKITDEYDGWFGCTINKIDSYYDDNIHRLKIWISFNGDILSEGDFIKVDYYDTCIDLPLNGNFKFKFIP